MNRLIKINTMIIFLFIIGCEDKADDSSSIVIREITTDNVSAGPYYFNLVTGEKDSTTWHLLYQNKKVPFGPSVYDMPNFSLDNGVLMAVENSMKKFEEIEEAPSPSAFSPEGGRLQYEGSNAALLYDMQSHKVSTSTENYYVYDTVTHKVFKIYFVEYSSGVVLFRYAELPNK